MTPVEKVKTELAEYVAAMTDAELRRHMVNTDVLFRLANRAGVRFKEAERVVAEEIRTRTPRQPGADPRTTA